MQWPSQESWITAFGLVLLIEGIVPFLFPKQWREAFSRLTGFTDGQIRFFGLLALLLGLMTLFIADTFF